MPIGSSYRTFLTLTTVFTAIVCNAAAAAKDKVSFSREVLPILSDRCFDCHGPDPSHRKADLRLDNETEAKLDRDGLKVIAPGDLNASELWQRLITDDEDEIMPPPDSHRKALSEA